MKKKNLIALFLSVVVFGCSSDSGEQTPTDDNDPPVQGETDTTAPVITLSGLEDTLEVLTTLNFSVTDASENVTTTVSIDGEDVFSSMEKQFSYELDPFDFTTGEKTLMVTSTDDSGNIGVESRNFELKKLLLVRKSTDFSEEVIDLYMAINRSTGELIEFRKIEFSESVESFYAPDGFSRQSIVLSEYVLGKNGFVFDLISSYDDVEPGTNLVEIEDRRRNEELPNFTGNNADESFDLIITETGNRQFSFFSNNYFSTMGFSDGPDIRGLKIQYDIIDVENIFIYTKPFLATDLEEYRYFIINEFNNQTISFNNFKSATNINSINLPTGSLGFSFALRGYIDQEGYDTNSFSELIKFSGNPVDFGFSLDFPLIEEYGILQQSLSIQLDDTRTVSSTFRGLSDLVVPNWGIVRSGRDINISADHDVSILELRSERPGTSESNPLSPFIWRYWNKSKRIVSIPFESFEIPQEVLDNINAKDLNIREGDIAESFQLVLGAFEEETTYDELIFNSFTNQRGNQTSMGFSLSPQASSNKRFGNYFSNTHNFLFNTTKNVSRINN